MKTSIDGFSGMKKNLVFTGITWLMLFVLAEAGVRLYDNLAGPESAAPEVTTNPEAIFEPHPFSAYVANPDNSNHNAQGYRADKNLFYRADESTINIVALGGSSTYGTRVYTHESYPFQLEEILRKSTRGDKKINVINAGLGGYATPNIISLLAGRVVHLQPAIVLLYTGFNDAWTRLMFSDFKTDYSHAQKVWEYPQLPFWRHSRLLDRIAEKLGHPAIKPHIHSVAWKSMSGAPEENFRRSSGQAFRRNLMTLIGIARTHGAIPVLITQATDFQNHPLPDNNAVWQKAMREHTRIIREVSGNMAVDLIDIRSQMSDKPEYFMDVLHMSPGGNRKRAEIIADFLLQNDLLGKGVQAKSAADLGLVVEYMRLMRADIFVQRVLKYRIDELRKAGTKISREQERSLLEAFSNPRNVVALYAPVYKNLSRETLQQANRFFASKLGQKSMALYAAGKQTRKPVLSEAEKRRIQEFQASASWQEIQQQRPYINRDAAIISNNIVLQYIAGKFKPPY